MTKKELMEALNICTEPVGMSNIKDKPILNPDAPIDMIERSALKSFTLEDLMDVSYGPKGTEKRNAAEQRIDAAVQKLNGNK